ncbi:YeaC family protein [Kangiella sediminilitoris]|uniref:DUF1315 domain-containing protein n=1 Tax=Kangiella sediminilitoris TaxID=1144748 RepID=A0A1B3BAI1_9GAMM|nr:DUF1315 family protein [Kangiella sediminilitoris]AOE49774.1 hypothetical protein KS2013_1054 [Kangiella sediminilitoris]
MGYSQFVENLTPDMIERFTSAVETGKWPDGTPLSEEQKETCIQAIMLYQAKLNQSVDEPFTITKDGELVTGKKIRQEYPGRGEKDKKQNMGITVDPDLIIPNKSKD